jgi:hypothetical protein
MNTGNPGYQEVGARIDELTRRIDELYEESGQYTDGLDKDSESDEDSSSDEEMGEAPENSNNGMGEAPENSNDSDQSNNK